MNDAMVDKLAKALLYEGYLLYPYRPSVKNSQRWTFGGIYPRAWSAAQNGTDASIMQTECLVKGDRNSRLNIIVRFLHLIDRRVGESPSEDISNIRWVSSLDTGGQSFCEWQEAAEECADLGELKIVDILDAVIRRPVHFSGSRERESICESDGRIVGVIERHRRAIDCVIEISAEDLADGCFKIRVRISNQSELQMNRGSSRNDALMQTLVSTHTILGISQGEFISLLDPPAQLKSVAATCKNVGTWPILVGEEGQHDTMLSSPIILYDYPKVAPESPGDLFDATEIDEILTLRILTLTDQEKRAAAGVDPRAGDLLARTEALAREQLMNLHGTIRGLRPIEVNSHHD